MALDKTLEQLLLLASHQEDRPWKLFQFCLGSLNSILWNLYLQTTLNLSCFTTGATIFARSYPKLFLQSDWLNWIYSMLSGIADKHPIDWKAFSDYKLHIIKVMQKYC